MIATIWGCRGSLATPGVATIEYVDNTSCVELRLSFLLAEVDGELVAAAPIDVHAEPLRDPFRPTANLRELLRLQVGHVRCHRDALARPAGAAPRALRDAA